MSVGLIMLVIVAVLTLFGITQRVLDGMRLSDRAALAFVAAMFIGGLIPDIRVTDGFSFNIGGALIPLILCVYLLIKAGSAWEKWRTIIACVVTGAAVYAMGRLLPAEPEAMGFDPNYLYGIVGGVAAYLLGRSRRGAFVAGVIGVMLADLTNAIALYAQGNGFLLRLGGGGAFDIILISGVLAVVLAEIAGEIIERASRGKKRGEQKGDE